MRKLGIGEYSRKARGMTITMPKDGYPRGFVRVSGADEGRTHNLLDATEALSQLSYCPQNQLRRSILALESYTVSLVSPTGPGKVLPRYFSSSIGAARLVGFPHTQ